MSNERERRRTDSESARHRRDEQQHSWEQAAHAHGFDHISESFAQALGALIDASRRLPVCDRAAKLHTALARLWNAYDKAAACDAAHELLEESLQALEEDPWFRFHRAAAEAEATLCKAA